MDGCSDRLLSDRSFKLSYIIWFDIVPLSHINPSGFRRVVLTILIFSDVRVVSLQHNRRCLQVIDGVINATTLTAVRLCVTVDKLLR